MPVSTDTLLDHIDYSAWASRKLVDASLILTREELHHDFLTADRSVLGTLVHIFAADRLWLARLAGTPHPDFVTEADRSLAVLQQDWPVLHDRWREWARGLSTEQTLAFVAYNDLKGHPWNQPLWKLVLHVVNHATHHRGQVSGFLRSLGHTPPPIDLVHYYRELG
jgi:uncharacterized damage-inducible protein DinB